MRIILCGFGVVGQNLAKLLNSRSEDLYVRFGLKPRIVGVADRDGSAVESSGLDLTRLIEIKKKFGSVKKYGNVNNKQTGLDLINNLDADVLVETTASNYKDAEPGMSHITSAMKQGLHVISVNKVPLALDLHTLMELATYKHVL